MLKLEDLHQILKSRPFRSALEDSSESYIFTFTQIYVFRDNKPVCIYELTQANGHFKFVFSNFFQSVSTEIFKNVTIMIEGDKRFPIIVNSDYLTIQAGRGFDITLIGL